LKDGGRIECFEERNKESRYSQYGMIPETYKYVTVESKHYDVNLKLLSLEETDEAARVWRKLQSEELHNLYSSPDVARMMTSKRIRWVGQVKRMARIIIYIYIYIYMILVGNTEGKTPLGRPRRRWSGNIKTVLREIGWGCLDLINLALDMDQWRAVVNTVMNLKVP
jgi:hypothetical protein